MGDTIGYEADPVEVAALLQHLCSDLLEEPDDLIAYMRLTAEQVLYDGLVSAIKRERGKRLASLKNRGGLTWPEVAAAAGLGTYQRAQKLVAAAETGSA